MTMTEDQVFKKAQNYFKNGQRKRAYNFLKKYSVDYYPGCSFDIFCDAMKNFTNN